MSPDNLYEGQLLDRRFELLRPLGSGGMGEVWLAADRQLGEEVAVKALPAGAPESAIILLRRECRNARRLHHPAVVPVYDFHQGEERTYITLAYVDGETLDVLRGASVERVVELLLPIAEALDHAHDRGVVHRDLKPSNVIVDGAGKPHLLDFGIAAAFAEASEPRAVGGGSRFNVSPQQLGGESATPADDLYAFGALLYEMLSGRPPFWPELDESRVREETPPALAPESGAPEALAHLVASLLAKSPGDRPADMRSVVTQLRAILARMRATEAPRLVSGGESHAPQVRLTPPPRIAPLGSKARPPAATAANRRPELPPLGWTLEPERRGRPRWVPVAALGLLGIGAVALYLLLAGRSGGTRPSEAIESIAMVSADETPAAPETVGETPETASELAMEAPRTVRQAPAAVADEVPTPAASPRRGPSPMPTAAKGPDPAFAAAMTEGLAALEEGEWEAARGAFEDAERIVPGTPEGADGRARAALGLRREVIVERQRRAAELEASESWREAEKEYAAVLAADPTMTVAREGLERARARADLAERLDYHLAHPYRLSGADVLDETEELIEIAGEVDDPGPRHRRQVAELGELVAAAAVPVRVALLSDNLTEVTVYRVGRLGAFARRELELRPGVYTVVGTRRGFRDVRRQLQVEPGVTPEPLMVRCEEEI